MPAVSSIDLAAAVLEAPIGRKLPPDSKLGLAMPRRPASTSAGLTAHDEGRDFDGPQPSWAVPESTRPMISSTPKRTLG